MASILDEVSRLIDQGYKEVTLLGQNVNSYHDKTTITNTEEGSAITVMALDLETPALVDDDSGSAERQRGRDSKEAYDHTPGFTNMYRLRGGDGARMVHLLDSVTRLPGAEELRVRFTSPHPKDFPLALLQLIAERPQLCNQLHLPAQSGSDRILERMRRGYTVEAYLELVVSLGSIARLPFRTKTLLHNAIYRTAPWRSPLHKPTVPCRNGRVQPSLGSRSHPTSSRVFAARLRLTTWRRSI